MNYMPNQDMTEGPQSADTEAPVDRTLNTANLAEAMSDEQLEELSTRCKEGYEQDLRTRADWEDALDEWTALAMQVRENKTYPWPNASNVKYPLLSTAAMQFAARAYPSLVPSDGKIVKTRVFGKDTTGAKIDKADRVSTYMSWQVLYDMLGWDRDMDKMLMMLPIVGIMFKKTYFDTAEQKVCSHLVLPKNLVVNHWAKSLDSAERVSEVLELSPRIMTERKRQGLFLDVELGDPANAEGGKLDETTPYTVIEQHTYFDRDKDGYEEPYIVTFHLETGKILRVVSRYELDDVEEKDGEIVRIKPTQYYTEFSFIPNPDGGFYSIGFGVLLGPLNESVNTLINQLVDAGSLNNLQSGFIGKGLRLKMGEAKFAPGEWKPVNATADDIRKQVLPLPTKEPSAVLIQLLTMLVTSGKELASVAEIFTGKMPGQNTPATTTMATVEQGMKVFTAVYKRIYRSLEEEFKKIYKLNKLYLDPNTYVSVLDIEVGPDDFDDKNYDICPGADPITASQSEKVMKAQALLELLPTGLLDPIEVVSRYLQAQEHPNWERLFAKEIQQSGQVPQQPDPKQMEMQMKMQLEQQKAQLKGAELQQKMELEARDANVKLAMQNQQHQMDMQHRLQMNNVDASIAEHKQKIFMVEGAQKLQQNQDKHQQSLQMQKESAKSKSTESGTRSGGRTK